MENKTYELLEKLNIKFTKQEHAAISSVKHCLNVLKGQQVKNLVLKAKKTNNIYFIIILEEKICDLKNLSLQLNEKRLSFDVDNIITDVLKSFPGGVTPLSLIYDKENIIKVIIDSDIDKNTTIGVHPFVNTATLDIQFSDFMKFLKYCSHEPIFLKL